MKKRLITSELDCVMVANGVSFVLQVVNLPLNIAWVAIVLGERALVPRTRC